MRKRTPRKVRDPMAWITKSTPLANDQQRDLGIAYHVSLQAMLRGSGTEQAWSTLACTLNIALILCEQGIVAAAMPTIKLAQEALLRARERAQRTNKWAFDGEGVRIIQSAVVIHDEQIEFATRGQIVAALEEVHRRVMIGEVA